MLTSAAQLDPASLHAELEARDKTIAVLIRRVEDQFSGSSSAMAVMEQNVSLERAIHRQNGELAHSHGHLTRTTSELKTAQSQLLESKKLEAVGQLAAGVAHEINTPIQYVSDNTAFLKEAFAKLVRGLDSALEVVELLASPVAAARAAELLARDLDEMKISWLKQEIPRALGQSTEGLERVASIVGALREFSHPGAKERQLVDLHEALRTTITVARNEWCFVAELETHFDPALPLVPCLRNELNQVFLNLIVNAAHAIAERTRDGAAGKGSISIETERIAGGVEVRVRDSGAGIPAHIASHVYDPFFTTKPVGKGTGQGLAIAHSVVVGKHGGTIHFDSQPGIGTCFFIRLPFGSLNDSAAQ